MLKKVTIASGVLALGLMSSGAFAQGIFPGLFGGNGPAAQSGPVKAPGDNRYAPYDNPAPVYVTGRAAPAGVAGDWAHNRYDPAVDATPSGAPVYASGYYASAARAGGVHNRYAN